MKRTIPSIFVFCCVLFSFLACPQVSLASVQTNSLNLPPAAGQYVSQTDWHAYYAVGFYIKDVVHSQFTAGYPPPPPHEDANEQFGSRIDGLVSMDGQNYQPFWASGNMTVHIESGIDSGNTRNFDTEILQLDVSGGSLPPGVLLRESPTEASTGETSITDLGNGYYDIESYFHVYTELSIDGGQTWWISLTPPAEMVFVPEPSSLILIGLGGLILRKLRA